MNTRCGWLLGLLITCSTATLAAGKPVTAIAHDFTLQPGVPLIRVADAVCRNGKATVALTQGEFAKDDVPRKPLSWRVPVWRQAWPVCSSKRTRIQPTQNAMARPRCRWINWSRSSNR